MPREATFEIIARWAERMRASGLVGEVFVFGSLVNYGGQQFDPQQSDVDIVAMFPADEAGGAIERHKCCVGLRNEIQPLEREIFFALKRSVADNPITSVSLVTSWEIENSIHKDGDPKLFYGAQFKSSSAPEEAPLRSLAPRIDYDFLQANGDLVRVIGFCQEVRNKYLRTNVHGRDLIDVSSGSDPVPKKVMRLAAQLAYRTVGNDAQAPSAARTDLVEGLEFLTVLLNDSRGMGSEIDELRRWLAVNRGGRGDDAPMSARHLLLSVELLGDKARSLIVASPTQKIETTIKRLAGD